MTNKKVGELWRSCEIFGSDFNANNAPKRSHDLKINMRELIRLLVVAGAKELALVHDADLFGSFIPEILDRYGIDPAMWAEVERELK